MEYAQLQQSSSGRHPLRRTESALCLQAAAQRTNLGDASPHGVSRRGLNHPSGVVYLGGEAQCNLLQLSRCGCRFITKRHRRQWALVGVAAVVDEEGTKPPTCASKTKRSQQYGYNKRINYLTENPRR